MKKLTWEQKKKIKKVFIRVIQLGLIVLLIALLFKVFYKPKLEIQIVKEFRTSLQEKYSQVSSINFYIEAPAYRIKVKFDSSSTEEIRKSVVEEVQQFVEEETFLQEATNFIFEKYPSLEGLSKDEVPSFTIESYIGNTNIQNYNASRPYWHWNTQWEEEKSP